MEKPGDFYISVLDFFGGLLPGVVTVGAAVFYDIPSNLPSGVAGKLEAESFRVAAFLGVAFVVGQVMNGVGSLALDRAYDVLYHPDSGRLIRPEGHSLRWWQRGLFECGSGERRARLTAQLEPIVGDGNADKPFQLICAWLKLAAPQAHADVEKHQADQKFFRSLTIGFFVLAVLLWRMPESIAFSTFALIAFVRYVSVRRKTVRRAYAYFHFRHLFDGWQDPRHAGDPSAAPSSAND